MNFSYCLYEEHAIWAISLRLKSRWLRDDTDRIYTDFYLFSRKKTNK